MSFFVAGKPVPQGSMNYFGGNFVHVKNNELLVWRTRINLEAKKHFKQPLEGEVYMKAVFYLPKPKSVKRLEPHVKPDLDKLVRAVCDALTGIAFSDDSQVTALFAAKHYGEEVGVRISLFKPSGYSDLSYAGYGYKEFIVEEGDSHA